MKRLSHVTALIVATLVAAAATASAQERHGGDVPREGGPQSVGGKKIASFVYAPIDWQVPKVGKDVERYVTKNGMVIYLKEDHTLPEFRISAVVRCGDMYEPGDREGLSDLVGTVMRSGGTESLPPDSLNALLEYMAASIETGIDLESGSASLYCLAKDTETGVKLFADVIRRPAFRQDKLDLAKEQIRKSIKSRNDNPGAIVGREFDHVLYGEHPYGRILEWATIKPITRDDLVAYHKRNFAPERVMMGITGDFSSGKIKKMIDKYFGDWKSGAETLPAVPAVPADFKPGVYFIEKDVNQSNIRFGHLGITQDNPDRYAISVMNFILGGGSFISRMTSRVRSDEGLAYSVGTRYETDSRDLGAFYAYCQTKSSTTLKAMRLMKDEVERIRSGEVTDDELALAKDSYINRYVFGFTSAAQIVGRLMGLEYDKRPGDELEKYLDNIRAVTKADVQRVAREYLHPDRISYVVVGKRATLDGDLTEFGEVHEIPLSEPAVD
jgi:predicted Zn-dependent peptidase